MDYDNPAGGGGWGVDDQSDFTDSEKSGKEKKEKHLLGSSKKKDKEKKKEKEKETKYNQLGAESSNDEHNTACLRFFLFMHETPIQIFQRFLFF